MQIIQPSVEFLGTVPTTKPKALRLIELAGRTCYKSESRITPESSEKFVKKLITLNHLAMIEHSNFVARGSRMFCYKPFDLPKFLAFTCDSNYNYVGGNLRAWKEYYNSLDLIPSFLEPFLTQWEGIFNPSFKPFRPWEQCPQSEIPHELQRFSVRFTCDRGVSHELVRHRPCSFAQESTRYVNYSSREMQFIEPWWAQESEPCKFEIFKRHCQESENAYLSFLDGGASPQAARAVLPNALKTELIITANAAEWAHIKTLRSAATAHPDMQRLMKLVPWAEILPK